jgi:radical SAM protein with 4Fe4S-binding SPASM domain
MEHAYTASGPTLARPYVVSWNLTYRCNLACEHCYLDAGQHPGGQQVLTDEAFEDRSELSTEECRRVVDEIAGLAPEALTILTGGEPLLRRDILEIVEYADSRKLWVVVGTNGILVTETLASKLAAAGVRGMALSLDSLDAARHDLFRRVRGAFDNTVEGAAVLNRAGLPFIVQTTVGAHNHLELERLAEFAHSTLEAKVWNLYFLVPSGRGSFVSDLTQADYDQVLDDLLRLQKSYQGRMLVNAKCAPHFIRSVLADDQGSPFLKSYAGGAGGCPAGTQYFGIRPNGDVTPCPYLPRFGGNLKRDSLAEIWHDSDLFHTIRARDRLGGRCGECELAALCGGCRARAWAATGNLLAEDPLCTHEPGSLTDAARALDGEATGIEYGRETRFEIEWEEAARERMRRVPAFVRGMVVRSVERWCREREIELVTPAILDELRARMPTPKMFGSGPRRPS